MKRALLLLLFPLMLTAQTKKIDSLRNKLKTTLPDSIRVRAYDDLLCKLENVDPDQALKEIPALENTPNCPGCKSMALFHRGQVAARKNANKEALGHFEQAAKLASANNDNKTYHRAVTWQVQILLNDHALDKAKTILDDYLSHPEQLYRKQLHDVYFLYGILNLNRGYLRTSIENYQIADSLLSRKGVDNPGMRFGVNNNIAQVYRELKNFPKAIEYTDIAKAIAEKDHDTMSIMNVLLNKGIIMTDAKQFDKAIPFLDKSFVYYDKIKYDYYKGSSALYLGIAYYGLREYQKSIYFLAQAKAVYEQDSDYISMAETMGYLARNYVATRKFADARRCVDHAKGLMKNDTDAPAFVEIIGAEVDLYEATGDFKNALRVTRYQQKLREALDHKTSEDNLNELEARYQSGKKDVTIQTLSSENEATSRQKRLQLYLFLAVLAVLGIGIWVAFYAYRNKLKTAERLRELDAMKSKFFANISHEFRTPLTLIKSPLQSLQHDKLSHDQQHQLALIDQNANRMLELVNQLLELSRIDSGHLKLILKEDRLDDFLKALVEPFAFQAEQQGTTFISNIENTGLRPFDRDVLSKITVNLLDNAFKHSAPGQPVYFSATVEGKKLALRFANSGTDLKKEELPRLFERFYRKQETANSSGIGLALVKELVDLYQGTIEVSMDDNTLRFLIQLPLTAEHPNAIAAPPETKSETMETVVADAEPTTEKPILLIVDDNAEIRNVLKSLFQQDYQVLEAPDGEQALKIAKKEIPDCIVSDVMMPNMTGMAFTHAIKNDELTSFIPLVLLTAKTSEDTHLEALRLTADAFLTKPFNHEIVKATVSRLILDRKRLQERYSRELVLRPMDIPINTVDEKFLDRLQRVVSEELANPAFSAESFASAIGMSRMQLHRKLKTLLGVSATEFVRNERLKAATELLRKPDVQVSEVAYAVGFNDLSYFSKCFREMYGQTPSEYANS